MAGFEAPYPTAISQVSKTGWKLIDHVVWHGTGRHGEPVTYEIPPGQETDFASSGAMSYADADRHLREMLRASGVSWLRRWIMFAAVRWGSLFTRRGGHKGWWRDALAVLGMSVIALPYVALPAVVNGVFALLFTLTEALISVLVPSSKGTPPKEQQ